MSRFLPAVLPEERQETWWAAGTAFLVLVAHALLETARDALFLSHLPASHLPWVYLAVAALALLAARPLARWPSPRRTVSHLIVLQVAAAAGTLALLVAVRARPPWALYALYIWGGLASMLILVRFWGLLGDRFTIGQAKRLFPVIAAGPLLGSLVGYGAAGLLSRTLPPADLLAAGSAAFLLSAGGSLMLARSGDPAAAATPRERVGLRESVAVTLRHPYVRRVALLLLTASVTVTLGDFAFKSVVAREIAAARLGTFLAVSYFSFDLVALVLLFTAVVPVVRSRGVSEALALQPALLLVGGVLLGMTGGLVAVLALRGIDGALRWSLHKTATEMLYVPLSPRLRGAVKAVSDIVAHRGGQALASVLLLGWAALSTSERTLGPVLVACAALWIRLAMSLRQPYLDLFRDTLSAGAIETRLEFPELDMASLETLVAALSSPDERKVLAALDLLEQTERVPLVPALILYHPSSVVILRALEIFRAGRRDDVVPLTERLLDHPDGAVRAAAMRVRALLRFDAAELRRAAESAAPPVAATALVALAAAGAIDPDVARERLDRIVEGEEAGGDEARRFTALAIHDHPRAEFVPLLERLARSGDVATRSTAARAIGAVRDPRLLPVLIASLAQRELREPMRQALLQFGDAGLAALAKALLDTSLPRAVRIHLPRTISRFPVRGAADLLLRHLGVEPSGTVRYKILRGLGRMVANDPGLQLPDELVDAVIERQLRALIEGLRWQVTLEQGGEERPERRTVGHELLLDLLREKEGLALERLFRALGLRHRTEDLAQIYDGLRSPEAATRASSRELLQGVLPAALRRPVLGLIEELPAAERLALARPDDGRESTGYDDLVRRLIGERSAAVSSLASYHAAELGLAGLGPAVATREIEGDPWLAALRRSSLDRLAALAAAGRSGVQR